MHVVSSPSNVCGPNNTTSLEEERDLLQSSLFALTTHFAQVQFRLKQVVGAPSELRDELLKSLEDFAFADISHATHYCDDVSNLNLIEEIRARRKQQNHLLSQLKRQLHQLSAQHNVEEDRTRLINDLEVKQQLEEQLRTQILDLERFVGYLKKTCYCKHRPKSSMSFKSYLGEFLERISKLFQFFALLHFGPENNPFKREHWGDLRAQLELTIINLSEMLRKKSNRNKITLIVRKDLSKNICALIEHGAKPLNTLSLIPILDCFQRVIPTVHGWEIILDYYHWKNGNEFNSSSIQTLSQSFNLEMAEASPKRNKTNLLAVVGRIISMHSKMQTSYDAHFKAFVCAGLNANRLVKWLSSIFQCGHIVESCYYPWSYVASTRYEDGLQSLDMLTRYKFDLPVDFDVERFQIDDFI